MKNFVVTSESVKGRDSGLAGYKNYLTMRDHPNHKGKTTEIVPVFNGGTEQDAIQNIMAETFDYEAREGLRRQAARVRGRYKLDSFAHSFVLSTPKINDMNTHIRPTPDEWKAIFKDVHVAMYKTIKSIDQNRYRTWVDDDGVEHKEKLAEKYSGLTHNDFAKLTFANVHIQKDGNDHMNLIIGKLVGKDKVIKELTQKAVLQNIKNAYTASLARHCGLRAEHYKPIRTGRPQKRATIAQAHRFELKEKLERVGAEFNKKLFKPLRNFINNIERENFEKADKWRENFEKGRDELFQNNVEHFGFEGAFAMDEKLDIELQLINELALNKKQKPLKKKTKNQPKKTSLIK